MPQLLDDRIINNVARIEQIDARLRTIEKLIHVSSDSQISIGFVNAYITVNNDGNVSITGYSKSRGRLVTVELDQIIN